MHRLSSSLMRISRRRRKARSSSKIQECRADVRVRESHVCARIGREGVHCRAFVPLVAALKVGNGVDAGVQIGPLIDQAGVNKVEAHVRDATSHGAHVRVGGHRPAEREHGYFFEPTVLTDVRDDMLVMREETFGPVAPIATFDSEDEVLAARQSGGRLGLAAHFYTRGI